MEPAAGIGAGKGACPVDRDVPVSVLRGTESRPGIHRALVHMDKARPAGSPRQQGDRDRWDDPPGRGHSVVISPPSMVTSAPVKLAARSLARKAITLATSSGSGKPAGDHVGGGSGDHCVGGRPTAAGDGGRDAAGAEPQVGLDRPRADRVDPDALRPDLFGQGLGEVGQRGLWPHSSPSHPDRAGTR